MIGTFFILLLIWRIIVFMGVDDNLKESIDARISPEKTNQFFSTDSFAKYSGNGLFQFFVDLLASISNRRNFLIFLFSISLLFSTCSFNVGDILDDIKEYVESFNGKPPIEYKYASQDINLRECASTDNAQCPIIAPIYQSDRVTVLEYVYGSTWIKVRYGNNEGYCNGHDRYWQ